MKELGCRRGSGERGAKRKGACQSDWLAAADRRAGWVNNHDPPFQPEPYD